MDDGWTEVSPRNVFTIVGKKHSTAAIAIFETGFSRPNQLLVIGANAMIGTALAAIANGMRAMPRLRKRASTRAARIPSPEPMTSPAGGLLERVPAGVPERGLVLPERPPDVGGLREEEGLHVERGRQPLPKRDRNQEDDHCRQPVAEPTSDLPREARGNRFGDRAHQYTSRADVLREPGSP